MRGDIPEGRQVIRAQKPIKKNTGGALPSRPVTRPINTYIPRWRPAVRSYVSRNFERGSGPKVRALFKAMRAKLNGGRP